MTSVPTVLLFHMRVAIHAHLETQTMTIACGQDTTGRDIVLKVVDNDSQQHRIYQNLLKHESLFTDPRTFPGVLPPIAIINTPHRYSIVTMPL